MKIFHITVFSLKIIYADNVLLASVCRKLLASVYHDTKIIYANKNIYADNICRFVILLAVLLVLEI